MKHEPITPEDQDNFHEKRKLKEQMEKQDEISEDDFRLATPQEFEVNNFSVRSNFTNDQVR